LTTLHSTNTYHKQAHQFFEKTAEEKARETKFVQRQSPLTGRLFLLTLVLSVLQSGQILLPRLSKTASKIDPKVKVSGQAFKERFTDFAVKFLKAMFAEALKVTAPGEAQIVPLLSSFSEVNLLDSSVVNLPDAVAKEFPGHGGVSGKAAAKVYLLLEWLTGAYKTIRLEAGRKADQNMGEEFLQDAKEGGLWIFDLGFFKAAFCAAIAAAQSFFLCRLPAAQHKLWVVNSAGELEPFDLDQFLRRVPRQGPFEIEVVFGPKKEVKARLIIAPVPPKVAAQRRRKTRAAAQRQGRSPTQRTLKRCDWTLMLTNASPEQLPTTTVLEVYRVRWQVELAFKLYKSQAQLETTLAEEKHRIQCEFYAKLIAILFFNRISGLVEKHLGEKCSPSKLWCQMQDDREDLLKVLGQGTARSLDQTLIFISRFAKPSSRKKYPSTLQRLQRAAEEARQVKLEDPLGYWRAKRKTAAERRKTFTRYLESRPVSFNLKQSSYQRTVSLP
jgi:hypothetical protein